jgi:MerR family transcriptional regulator, copper efflux regulator
MSARLVQIGEVADAVGLSLRTLRYYEQMGLLEPEQRSDGGFRLYSETQIDRLRLIKRMKPLGFQIDQMRDLLRARDTLRDPGAAGGDREIAQATLREYAASSVERVLELRAKLAYAEEFCTQLADEAARPAAG